MAYKEALDQNTIVSVTNNVGRITYANDKFCAITGYPQNELVGQKISMLNSGFHDREFFQNMWKTISAGRPWHDEICNRNKSGDLYWIDTTIVPRRNHKGVINGYVSIRHDITERKFIEMALQEEVNKRKNAEEFLTRLLETIPDGVIAFDSEDKLIHVNSAYKEMHTEKAGHLTEGISFEQLLRIAIENGQYMDLPDDPRARESYIENRLKRHLRPNRPIIQQLRGERWIQVQERRSSTGCTVGICTDITDIKQAEKTIKIQAEKDPLTGLFNRSVLINRLSKALCDRSGVELKGALLLIDLDHFKDINDTLGHDAGDQLLIEIANRLSAVLRKSDTVARIGGDEFAVLLPNMTLVDDLEKLLKTITSRLGEVVSLGHRSITPSCSLGVTLFPADGKTPKDLLKNADIALYRAKEQGRGIWVYFDRNLKKRVERRQTVADALRKALSVGQIKIAAQPQVCFQTGQHVGFEVLARWKHKGRQMSPAEFIPIAEETGLIIPLGHTILEQAMSMARDIREKGYLPGRIAVNVAASQLKQLDFVDTFHALLCRYGLEASSIEIEVTENVLLDRTGNQIAKTLEALHNLGALIALDDFGTGHASLSHLKSFPVSCLKIDQSFVREIQSNAEDSIIIRAIINLAHNLGMQVVAEGIETREQYEHLDRQGCDFAQGYYLGFPVSPDEALSFCAPRESVVNTLMRTA